MTKRWKRGAIWDKTRQSWRAKRPWKRKHSSWVQANYVRTRGTALLQYQSLQNHHHSSMFICYIDITFKEFDKPLDLAPHQLSKLMDLRQEMNSQLFAACSSEIMQRLTVSQYFFVIWEVETKAALVFSIWLINIASVQDVYLITSYMCWLHFYKSYRVFRNHQVFGLQLNGVTQRKGSIMKFQNV